MKSLTCWKVFQCTTNENQNKTVLIGLNTETNSGIVEEVLSASNRQINDYKLFGEHNDHFVGFQELWTNYCTANNVNSITDVSVNY